MNNELFRQLNNALLDLQSSQPQTFARPLKTLGRLLKSEELSDVNKQLTQGLDLEEFLTKNARNRGGMMGSATLDWPEDSTRALGITLLLIYKLADDTDFAINFGFEYFYSDNRVISGIHSITRQILIPFVRDYKSLIESRGIQTTKPRLTNTSTKIFVVHGHDGEAREMVARFLQTIGFTPVILHEQANKGRTIIEKIEANSDVGFAVVLLTPDDEGRVKGGQLEPRARQNVLLELGYFMAALGRERVCALKRGEVNIPSDFAGVVWESMDAGGWKLALGRELAAAGYEIDWNKVML